MFDYFIVGQGIAGTLLTHFLREEGASVLVIDEGHERASSFAAAGIINPITGRWYVKSWRVDELIPFAQKTYRELEIALGAPLYHPRNILRSLFSQKEENDWQQRFADPEYRPYMIREVDIEAYASSTQPAFSYGEVTQSAQVNLPLLIQSFRKKWIQEEMLLEERFDFDLLHVEADHVQYRDFRARRIVFCEGWRAKQNPFFSYLPFGGSKGEVLIVDIPEAAYHKMLKHRVFVVPLENNHYWIGSAYQNQFEDELPTASGRSYLEERLRALLTIDFQVVKHLAAVRPTVKDRRPFLGAHPEYPHLFIFNGLGTKGASLGPFFARQMTDFLLGKGALDPAVRIDRFH